MLGRDTSVPVQLIANGVLTNETGGSLVLNGVLEARDNVVNNGTITSGANGLLSLTNASASTISGSGTTLLTDVTFSGNATNTFDASLTNAVKVARVARVQGQNVYANSKLCLTSNRATTTGMIYNAGTGKVLGNVLAQRSISAAFNDSVAGYRHFSSPVTGATFSSLATSGPNPFTPIINTAYAYPGANQNPSPFPNIFYYDEALVTSSSTTNGNRPFDYGWRCPSNTTLDVTRGYTVRIHASETVTLTGVANTGNLPTAALGRGTQTESGYHLVGNPYPGPIDARAVSNTNVYNATNNPGGFDASLFFFRSTSSFAGTYEYINPVTGNSSGAQFTRFFPMMQGFFVRRKVAVTSTNPATAFRFLQTHRSATYGTSPALTPFYRSAQPTAAEQPATLDLDRPDEPTTQELAGAELRITDLSNEHADYAAVSFRSDATPGHDAAYDAVRPGDNMAYPTFFTVNADAEPCAYNALPALQGSALVTVGLHTLVAGRTYTIEVSKNNLAAGTRLYLEDRQTGKTQELGAGRAYTFKAGAESYEHRFFLRFSAADAPAVAATRSELTVYPNPAVAGGSLAFSTNQLPTGTVTATLLDAYGRAVSAQTLPVREGLVTGEVSTQGLLPGIYLLRVAAGGKLSTQRIEVH